jgi:hypothetical protein
MIAIVAVVLVAGAIGGVLNALISDEGLFQPRVELAKGIIIWRPGFFSNVFFGAIAAFVSWALYGPLNGMDVTAPQPTLALATIGGAVLMGIGGTRWLRAEVDKQMLKVAASKAAAAPANAEASQQIMMSSPAQALTIAANLEQGSS